jgi:hypothetical protein
MERITITFAPKGLGYKFWVTFPGDAGHCAFTRGDGDATLKQWGGRLLFRLERPVL